MTILNQNKVVGFLFFWIFVSGVSRAGDFGWQRLEDHKAAAIGPQDVTPTKYLSYALNVHYLGNILFSCSQDPNDAQVIGLPTPDGNFRRYKVWASVMMEDDLAEKYNSIKTFTAYAIDNPYVTAKLDFTGYGFHAMVFDDSDTYFIDPFSNTEASMYMCYYKRDYTRPSHTRMSCLVDDSGIEDATYLTPGGLPDLQMKSNGTVRRNYRLALACTGEYAVAVTGMSSPAKSLVLSKMVTSLNRVNGIYERELAVHLTLVANEDTLIFVDGSSDPYSNNTGSGMLNENVTTIDARIGPQNYDIGHVFSTGGGGLASLGCLCNSNKARGVTGSPSPVGDPFDIDYVSHEIGHQFGAQHSFNSTTGSCASGAVSAVAYEPGSGSTILGYAGICGGDNIQLNSDSYFHAISLDQISANLAGTGGSCATTQPSGNNVPTLGLFTKSFTIPISTPFELIAPDAIDIDHDTLAYCWEQWNKGDFGKTFANTRLKGPIFRSFKPAFSRTRVLPAISKMLAGVTSYLGEKLPDTTRFLTFKLTVRDIYNGIGTFYTPDDTIHLDVTHTAGPFKVTSPSTPVNWQGGSAQAINWDVASTDLPPVSCAGIDIYLSVDGGQTFPVLIQSNTPNDGLEIVTIPNVVTTSLARLKVKAAGNVFFNVNNTNFAITNNPSLPTVGVMNIAFSDDIIVYPMPASDVLSIGCKKKRLVSARIANYLGQNVWSGEFVKQAEINISDWPRGIYILQLEDNATREKVARSLIIL